MPAKFFPAPEVEAIAKPIIESHHPHLLKHNVRIEYLFRDVPAKKNGKTTWGDARKISSLAAYLAGEDDDQDEGKADPFFVICMALPIWTGITESQRKALTDHELCHCGAEYDDKGKTKLFLIPHDMEEFRDIYARHGDWVGEVESFLRAREEAQRKAQTNIYDVDGVDPNQHQDSQSPSDGLLSPSGQRLLTSGGLQGIEAGPLKALPEPAKMLPAAPEDVFEGEFRESGEDEEVDAGTVTTADTLTEPGIEPGWENADSPEIPDNLRRIREEREKSEFGSGDDDIPMARAGKRSRRVPAEKGGVA